MGVNFVETHNTPETLTLVTSLETLHGGCPWDQNVTNHRQNQDSRNQNRISSINIDNMICPSKKHVRRSKLVFQNCEHHLLKSVVDRGLSTLVIDIGSQDQNVKCRNTTMNFNSNLAQAHA